uniref:Replication helicase subunit n=1 Tax=Lophurella caespitosa TaxID=2666335 RepID=UPI002551F7D8|nr:Replication helicase subunit [Lophurella caespitosa]WGH13110.1 Replication helicase subunit [Lophurella caespitosa]
MSKLSKYKFIPQNYLAEEILLGIIFIYPNIFDSIKSIIKKEYFFLERNQIIYLQLNNIDKKNQNNTYKILYKLQHNNLLLKIGGIERISKMMKQSQIFISSSKINYYTENLVRNLKYNYIKRLIIQFGYNIIKIAYIENLNNNSVYTKILSYIYLIEKQINQDTSNTILNIKDLVAKKLLELKYQHINLFNQTKNTTTKSGFFEIDNIIPNLPKGNLIIIAGRPSIGKTSFAINIAYNVFFYQKISVLIFSLEMSNYEVFNKIISIASQININPQNIAQLTTQEWNKISNICNILLDQNIYINDKSNIGINYINQIAKNLKKKTEHLNLIIIDYLQLIEFYKNKEKKYSRSQEIGYITRKLKLLAQFLKLPIIIISQLNRNIEIRSNKEPLLSDLKESGCIKYKDNINIKSEYSQEINIYNIRKKVTNRKILILNNKKKDRTINIKYHKRVDRTISSIKLSTQYIFQCINNKKILLLTHNHQHLSQYYWVETNEILLLTTISITKNNIVYKEYINTVFFQIYSKSYDLNQNQYFNIISQRIITHNSIEQDADIIFILYETEETKHSINLEHKKTINLKICKNRNGSTGLCKLYFIPKISTFKDIK